jgi:FkbM family methyltransferase
VAFSQIPHWYANGVKLSGNTFARGPLMLKNSCQPFPSFIEMTDSRYGRMLYPANDEFVGKSFKAYGEFSSGEVALFSHFIQRGAIVLDVGANIGAHTVPLAQLAGSDGLVLAFEPQPILHQMLCANLALNSIPNVRTFAMALGNSQGSCTIPVLDYAASKNFGGIEMNSGADGEVVPLGMLDDFGLDRVDFIKLDVEGFESKVLEGGAVTIDRCRPVIYLENDRKENSAELIQRLFDLGYRLWWHVTPLFNPNNFKGNPENIFPRLHSGNMLALHRDRPFETDLRPVTGTADWGI